MVLIFISNLEYIMLFIVGAVGIVKTKVDLSIRKCISSLGVILFTTIIMERIQNISADLIISMLSTIIVLCILMMKKRNIVLFAISMTVCISMLEQLAESLIVAVEFLASIEMQKKIRVIIAQFILLIILVGISWIIKDRDKGLKDIPYQYLLIIFSIVFIDSFSINLLGDYVVNHIEVNRKMLLELAYIFTVLGVFVQLGLLVAMILSRDEHKEKEALNAKYLEDQVAHYEYLEKREQETRKFRHDMTNHMMILRNLYDTGTEAEFEEYFDTISKRITAFGNQISVGNNTADAIINQYAQEAENAGIKLKVDGHFSPDCHISAVDICTIFSNLLSNAIRAEKEANGEEVELFIRNLDHDLFIEVSNDYVTQVKRSGERFISTKEDRANHGLGLQNVYDCVERNHGVIHITTDHQIFDVKLNLKNTEA